MTNILPRKNRWEVVLVGKLNIPVPPHYYQYSWLVVIGDWWRKLISHDSCCMQISIQEACFDIILTKEWVNSIIRITDQWRTHMSSRNQPYVINRTESHLLWLFTSTSHVPIHHSPPVRAVSTDDPFGADIERSQQVNHLTIRPLLLLFVWSYSPVKVTVFD